MKNKKMIHSFGFTLIELMMVISVIGILATIAASQYQDYIIRTQVVEGLSLASAVKTAVADFYSMKERLPSANGSVGVALSTSVSGHYVTSVDVGASGGITITYGNHASEKIANKTLGLGLGRNNANGLVWVCGTAGLPLGTTLTALQPVTTIVNRYLSEDCRS
jgi:type IV pilus assembly protein PilA